MKPIDIRGRTRNLGAPNNWDQNLDGECGVLPLRDAVDLQSGVPFMESLWQPQPEELALLNKGLPILLRVSGTGHPVVSMGVANTLDVPKHG
jgi:hypothetical protein